MAINIAAGFSLQSSQPNFERDMFKTILEMKDYPESSLPEMFICTNVEDGNIYIYNVNNSVDATTGKWRKFVGSGGTEDFTEYTEEELLAMVSISAEEVDIFNGLLTSELEISTTKTWNSSAIKRYVDNMCKNVINSGGAGSGGDIIVNGVSYRKVTELPTTDIDTNVVYIIETDSDTHTYLQNMYDGVNWMKFGGGGLSDADLEEIKKSVGDGKKIVTDTIAELGIETVTDPSFEAISNCIRKIAENAYNQGYIAGCSSIGDDYKKDGATIELSLYENIAKGQEAKLFYENVEVASKTFQENSENVKFDNLKTSGNYIVKYPTCMNATVKLTSDNIINNDIIKFMVTQLISFTVYSADNLSNYVKVLNLAGEEIYSQHHWDGVGTITFTDKAPGTYIIRDRYWSKEVVLDGNTKLIKLMPDGAGYWGGHNEHNFASTGATISGYTSTPMQIKSQVIMLKPANSTCHCTAITQNKIDMTKYNTMHIGLTRYWGESPSEYKEYSFDVSDIYESCYYAISCFNDKCVISFSASKENLANESTCIKTFTPLSSATHASFFTLYFD